MHYFHGTNDVERIMDCLLGSGMISTNFHLTPDIEVASNYGRHVIEISLAADLEDCHIGFINNEGNYNPRVGHGIEVVLRTPRSINSLYRNLVGAREVKIDLMSQPIDSIVNF